VVDPVAIGRLFDWVITPVFHIIDRTNPVLCILEFCSILCLSGMPEEDWPHYSQNIALPFLRVRGVDIRTG
jgi:hypothetical protein